MVSSWGATSGNLTAALCKRFRNRSREIETNFLTPVSEKLKNFNRN